MQLERLADYEAFLQAKQFTDAVSGFDASVLNGKLFDFQEAVTWWALRRGRAALFLDTGLGKSFCQSEWAYRVHEHTGGDVLILAPLCVAQQTVKEAEKLGIEIRYCRDQSQVKPGITITNYEMLGHFDADHFVGIVLDESSILKHQDSKTRKLITESFRNTPYRLACTATPAPNDHMELGNHAEFLGIMSATEMLAMFFTHDGGNTSKWRLKGHGKSRFWEWLATWAIAIRNPDDLGFDGSRFVLPPMHVHEHVINAEIIPEGQLFAKAAETLNERRAAKRETIEQRVAAVADMVNRSDEEWIVWCHLNDESKMLADAITDAVEVTGSQSLDKKADGVMGFTTGKNRVLVSKSSICGFGMNWQHCRNIAFIGLTDSFEEFYQSIRRCWRFGQNRDVHVHLICAEAEGQVKANLERKQQQADEMASEMVEHMKEFSKREVKGASSEKSEYEQDEVRGDGWTLYLGDCIDVISKLEESSIDYSIFSPPFASLYTYSNSDRDMGNSRNYSEFYAHFEFLVSELLRVTKTGRLLSFHCMNLQMSKTRDGVIGIHDFRGELIRMFVDAGWIFHSEVCIWKDPVTAMQRTKALGLLWKQLKKDSAMSRQGIPDYLITMRKPGDNPDPISHHANDYPVDRWQRIASPVWMDINPSRTLQFREARENDDERHICPLQLDVIERAIELWSNPRDLVLSPFAGIGSEGHVAIQMNRRFVGIELKRSYWELAKRNLQDAKKQTGDLLAEVL